MELLCTAFRLPRLLRHLLACAHRLAAATPSPVSPHLPRCRYRLLYRCLLSTLPYQRHSISVYDSSSASPYIHCACSLPPSLTIYILLTPCSPLTCIVYTLHHHHHTTPAFLFSHGYLLHTYAHTHTTHLPHYATTLRAPQLHTRLPHHWHTTTPHHTPHHLQAHAHAPLPGYTHTARYHTLHHRTTRTTHTHYTPHAYHTTVDGFGW